MHACKGAVQLLRSRGAALDFAKCFVKDFGDIKKTDDVAFFVTNRLRNIISFNRLRRLKMVYLCLPSV